MPILWHFGALQICKRLISKFLTLFRWKLKRILWKGVWSIWKMYSLRIIHYSRMKYECNSSPLPKKKFSKCHRFGPSHAHDSEYGYLLRSSNIWSFIGVLWKEKQRHDPWFSRGSIWLKYVHMKFFSSMHEMGTVMKWMNLELGPANSYTLNVSQRHMENFRLASVVINWYVTYTFWIWLNESII